MIDFDFLAIRLRDLIAHARRSGDQLQIKFALQSLLNDLHVQQAEKAAAEAESECNRTFGLEEKRRIVEPKFFERLAQLSVLVRVHGVEPGEDHGLDVFKAGQWLDRRIGVVNNGVTD